MSDHTNDAEDDAFLLDLVYKKGLSAAQWREIGTRLNVKSGKLNEIQCDHQGSSMNCLLKTISMWRNQYVDAETLETFKSALR